jgi:hypothetical protein
VRLKEPVAFLENPIESILRPDLIVEDLYKELNAETIECKCADAKQKVIRTKEHALKAALQKESRRHETLLAEKKQLATLTGLRCSNCENKRKRSTKSRGNGSRILGAMWKVCGRRTNRPKSVLSKRKCGIAGNWMPATRI